MPTIVEMAAMQHHQRISLLVSLINQERVLCHREPLSKKGAETIARVWSDALNEIATDKLELRFQQARASRKEMSNYPVSASELMHVHTRKKYGWFWWGPAFDWFHSDSWQVRDGELVERVQR